jgi:Peptidase family M23
MRPPIARRDTRCATRWLGMAAAAVLLVSFFILGDPVPMPASASAVPMVFPLEYRVPVSHTFFAARSGHLHQGIDLMAPKMTKEVAVVSGTVTLQVRTYGGLPWYTLWLAGDDGRGYYYSHINDDTPGTDDGQGGLEYAFAPGLVTGSRVRQGQFLAYCGDSGNAESTAPHLHFEIHETTSMSSPAIDPYDSLYSAPLADDTPPPAWPGAELTSFEQTDSRVTYTGTWTTLAGGEASGGDYIYTNSKGEALIWFEGTGLDVIATKDTTQGLASVSLDGAPAEYVDLHSPAILGRQVVWSSGTLTQGTHTVSVAWTGQRSVSDGGTGINIDALAITGKLLQAPALTTFQETNSLLSYAGGWTASPDVPASGGSLRSADTPGASVVAQFTGVYAAWVANTGQGYGMAKVTLDHNDPVMVDLYSASTLYRQKVWTSGMIGYGAHVIKIEWSGLGNQAATGTTINLDALQSIGALEAVGTATWEGPTAGMTIEPPPPGDPPPSSTRYDQTNINIVKTGTWTDYTSPSAYNGSYGRSATSLASATIYFTGTRLDWIAMEGTTTGKADVYVDGVKVTTTPIDLAASVATYQVPVFTTGTLSNGSHNVKIERSAASASGKYLTLDAVDISGTISQPPVPKTRYEQTTTAIVKTGTWANYTSTAASGGSYGRSSTAGASATTKFVGTRLDYIAMKGTTTGYAEIWVDGVKVTGTIPINLYASPAVYEQTIYSTGALAFGLHTVKIVRASASATGKYLPLDAFDVWGWITS